MLKYKLREDRHPRHAAEVRENVVPGTLFFLYQLISDYNKFRLATIRL